MDRPAGVPVEAQFAEGWEVYPSGPRWPAWVAGSWDGGERSGTWRVWRPDGSLLEESEWRAGKRRGAYRRFHDDGSPAVSCEYADDVVVFAHGYRTDNPSRDPFSFDGCAAAIRSIRNDYDGDVLVRTRCYAADGGELTIAGEPMPPRPAGVPEIANLYPNGLWAMVRRRGGELHGVARHWNADGTPHMIAYNRAGHEVGRWGDKPLVEAARDGDAASVELCLAAGLGRSPGAARYVAYEELPELALRLLRREPASAAEPAVEDEPPGPPPAGAPGDAIWVAGLRAYVVGDVDEGTGTAIGTWRIWEQSRYSSHYEHSYVEADFADGRRAERRSYFSSGGLVRLERRGSDGTKLKRAWDHRHRLDSEREWAADGTETLRRFHDNGVARMERTTRDDAFVVESWFDESGTRTAEVTPTDATVDGQPVDWWRALDATGAVIAEGPVEPGTGGGPVGQWRLFGPGGTDLGDVSFEGLDRLANNANLGRVAHALRAWHAAPAPPELAGADAVAWDDLDTFHGRGSHLPFLLKGLTVADPHAFSVALAVLSNLLWHQHTVAEATGPAFRYMTALVDRVATDDDRKRLLDLLMGIATRDGSPAAVHRLKRIHASLPGDATNHGAECAYHEVLTSLADAVPTWTRLAAHRRAGLRRRAVTLLAAAPGAAAADALRDRLATEPKRKIRAAILLGLALHDSGPQTRQALQPHLRGDDPLLRFCAALTWVRQHHTPAADGVRVLVDALRGDLVPTGYGSLFLGEEPLTDVTTALALLPADQAGAQLTELCAVLDQVNAVDAVSVANALLDIVFPTAAYQEGDPLTDPQRTVIRAIAESANVWTFDVNLSGVLGRNGLPNHPDELHALAGADLAS
ncbi:hypothetical protein AB0M46_34405 [Dactylosporangium sp. NPDC051485]|uniref:toxin-antitoxin system YwqK family antitoxin n=1 Tax=Dactylosporangium sp. NPDC051485 TaxID=3154846 RepID=UPI003420E798